MITIKEETMLRSLLVALVLAGSLAASAVKAGDGDPLFVNLTSNDGHRVTMALTFAGTQLERAHPLTVWLNDKAVLVASKKEHVAFGEQQKMLAALIAKGASVIVCPMCMKHFDVKEADLIDGAKIGNPDMTGAALFKEGTQTLTW
jgi:intracellular sulfur oxidation DsrE/DsrF family protein